MIKEDFYIPVNDAIERFHEHLKEHNRTILSAKFGDGKSFFFQQFMEDEDVKKDFKFLVLYPVNYQVAENRDVFELIKYDLLIQMFTQGIMSPEFKLSKAQALAWCLQLHSPSIAEGLLPIISELCLDEKSVKQVSALLVGKKLIGKVKQNVKDLEGPVRDRLIEQFLKEMSKNPITGQDVITGIIQQGIAEYKNANPGKDVVLVIEDMDRMDPAHLFRILNVFSAHIDYNFRMGEDSKCPYIGNKFGLDKVVFVMCYDNTEKIFKHFYGARADFPGYINKFCSSNYFTYSFCQEKEKYYYDRIVQNTKIDWMSIKVFIRPEDLQNHTIREVVNAIENLDRTIVLEDLIANADTRQPKKIHNGILKVISILRKLGMTDEKIKERLVDCMKHQDLYKMVFSYMGCYIAYIKRKDFYTQIHYCNPRYTYPSKFEVRSIDDNGKANCEFYRYEEGEKKYDAEMSEILDKLLRMVSA